MTTLFDFKNGIIDEELLQCINGLKCGKLVVFPTETVYGIGANSMDKVAVDNIFKAKGRAHDNPLIVHVSDKEMIYSLVSNINEIEEKIIDIFCPGPLTIILPKKDHIPDNVTCGLSTVGIRMPSNNIAHILIQKSGIAIAAPSANISGKPSGTNIEDIYSELQDKVDYIIDGGVCDIGLESTVIKVIDNKVKILRPGKISPQDFINNGFEVQLDEHIFESVKNNEIVESPGMKHKHYAPSTNTIMVYSKNEEKQINKIKEILKTNKRVCIIGYEEHFNIFKNVEYISMGSKYNLTQISKNIFSALRRVDKLNVDICILEGVEKEGLGIAIMNRLIRACGYNFIEI